MTLFRTREEWNHIVRTTSTKSEMVNAIHTPDSFPCIGKPIWIRHSDHPDEVRYVFFYPDDAKELLQASE